LTIFKACKLEESRYDPAMVEALGVRWGLQTALEQNFRDVCVLTEASVVGDCIAGTRVRAVLESVSYDCHALMSKLGNVSVKYRRRQNNVAAHN